MIYKNKFGKFTIIGNELRWGNKPHNWVCVGDKTCLITKVSTFQMGLRVFIIVPCVVGNGRNTCYDIYFDESHKNNWDYVSHVIYRGCER